MAVKVKVFQAIHLVDLETPINDFLSTIAPTKVIDVKVSIYAGVAVAVVIFKE